MQRRELLIGLTALSALSLAGCGDKKTETEIKLAGSAAPTVPSEPLSPPPTAGVLPSIRINAWSAAPAFGQPSAP